MPCTSLPEGVWSMDSVAETRVTPAAIRLRGDVVGAVAGEPVELVHDHDVDPVGTDPLEHLRQRRTRSRAR